MTVSLEVANVSGVLYVRDTLTNTFVNSSAGGLTPYTFNALRYLATATVDNSLPGVTDAASYLNYKLPEIAYSVETHGV